MAIDKAALDRLLALVGDEEGVIEVVSEFLDEGPILGKALSKSASAADLVLMRRTAHSIKSNARDMGASELADACARIEALAADGVFPDESLVAGAVEAMTAAVAELKAMYGL